MSKPIKSINDLTTDARNANRGTKRGYDAVEYSLRNYGAGRSIVVDRNGKVIGGNKTLEKAVALGLEIETIATDGTKLVVVQRLDLDMDTDPRARELAIADNRTSELGLEWDIDVLKELAQDGIDLTALFDKHELIDIGVSEPEFLPEGPDSRLDQLEPIECPNCGHVFTK